MSEQIAPKSKIKIKIPNRNINILLKNEYKFYKDYLLLFYKAIKHLIPKLDRLSPKSNLFAQAWDIEYRQIKQLLLSQ